MIDQFIKLVEQYGPAIGVLIVSWYRDKLLAERHKRAVAELEQKFLQNKAEVDAKFSGKSSADIITSQGGS